MNETTINRISRFDYRYLAPTVNQTCSFNFELKIEYKQIKHYNATTMNQTTEYHYSTVDTLYQALVKYLTLIPD